MDCFGSDDDEDSGSITQRDASCGICSFHPHTEASLITHVRNSLALTESSILDPSIDARNVRVQRADRVLHAIDQFCMTRHWMMHIGPEKGDILTGSLREFIDARMSSQPSPETSLVIVELGSYCGYSSILMAKECLVSYGNKLDFKLITMEINPEYVSIAREMIRLSGFDDVITILEISYNGHDTNVVPLLQEEMKPKCNEKQQDFSEESTIDLLFIDHDKDSYKSDLMKLEAAGFLRCGTRVIADNVIFAQIDDYLEYVKRRQEDGVVKTTTVSCHVEYSNDESSFVSAADENLESFVDGIGFSTGALAAIPQQPPLNSASSSSSSACGLVVVML
eukprot:CCRYP_008620-RD/>CCRYP_008620-RD protein AED:0.40 eAED:0.45 QI:258/0/0.5/1/0/0/2/0/336